MPRSRLWVPETRFASTLTGVGFEGRLLRISLAPVDRSSRGWLLRAGPQARAAQLVGCQFEIAMGRYAATSYS
jgi:hypothetical protein